MADNVQIIDHSDQFGDAITRGVLVGLEKCGKAAERYAKQLCPVGTPESTGIPGYQGGTLRENIGHAVIQDDLKMVLGDGVKYAPHVEFGTYKMRAQPFLRPALNDHLELYRKVLKTEIKKAVK